eukprot:1191446-Prorocentrum_minimum.AAC.3
MEDAGTKPTQHSRAYASRRTLSDDERRAFFSASVNIRWESRFLERRSRSDVIRGRSVTARTTTCGVPFVLRTYPALSRGTPAPSRGTPALSRGTPAPSQGTPAPSQGARCRLSLWVGAFGLAAAPEPDVRRGEQPAVLPAGGGADTRHEGAERAQILGEGRLPPLER